MSVVTGYQTFRDGLSEMGFDIEASHHEVALSQREIDFTYGNALTMVNKFVTFKFTAKILALRRNMHAIVMAKSVYGINGSGMHVNCSLMKVGENVFYDENGEYQLSETARYRRCDETHCKYHKNCKPDYQLLQASDSGI